jgi:hypothetical protein
MNGIHEVTGSIPVWSTNSPLVEPRAAFTFTRTSLPREQRQ